MKDTPLFTLEQILPILPHRPPFLFVDSVIALDRHKFIVAGRTLRPDEPQFAGHFPGWPIMPGVLVAEALAQASGLLLALSDKPPGEPLTGRPRMFLLASTSIKYIEPARPGDVLRLSASSDRVFSGLFRFNVEAAVGPRLIASGSLTLAELGDSHPGGLPGRGS